MHHFFNTRVSADAVDEAQIYDGVDRGVVPDGYQYEAKAEREVGPNTELGTLESKPIDAVYKKKTTTLDSVQRVPHVGRASNRPQGRNHSNMRTVGRIVAHINYASIIGRWVMVG